MKFARLLIILLGIFILQPGRAHEPVPHYDHISLSANASREVSQDLIQTAIRNFEQRASLATRSLGRKKYRIIDLNISTHGMRPPQPMLARSLSSVAEADAAPAIQAGTQLVEVTVEGKIEIQLN